MAHAQLLKTQNSTGSYRAGSSVDETMWVIPRTYIGFRSQCTRLLLHGSQWKGRSSHRFSRPEFELERTYRKSFQTTVSLMVLTFPKRPRLQFSYLWVQWGTMQCIPYRCYCLYILVLFNSSTVSWDTDCTLKKAVLRAPSFYLQDMMPAFPQW